MSRLGPQAKKLFDYTSRKTEGIEKKKEREKKYTFILPVELMKKAKHSAVEKEKTISEWVAEAIKAYLSD